MSPKISIIVPAYNTEKYVAQAIESVLQQTEEAFEIIVIDDASTDATVEVVKSFSDSRLRLIVNEKNGGVSCARNRALEEARGEWIALLDSDDWYSPNRLEKLLEAAVLTEADLIADDVYFVQNDLEKASGTLFSVNQEFNQPKHISSLTFVKLNMESAKSSPHLGLTKPIIKHDFLIQNQLRYNEGLNFAEDYHLYLMCLARGAKFITIPEGYYFYRRSRQDSLAQKNNKLKRLNELKKANLSLLQEESIRQNSQLASVLRKYLSKIDKEINYYCVTQLIQKEGVPSTLLKLLKQPLSLIHFSMQAIKILKQNLLS